MTDAHLHLQDERLAPFLEGIFARYAEEGVTQVVVNGTAPADWSQVAELAMTHPDIVIPSFGLHPWFVEKASPDWRETLAGYLTRFPNAGVGEAGLDRWIEGYDLAKQEPVFRFQMQIAAEQNRPLSIHCLKAWGRMLEMLESGPLPARGFLLHSYGGPVEMIPAFARLGAFFSFSGYYLHERKRDRQEALKRIPADRLLMETDAPDMPLPEAQVRFPLPDGLNHPANLSTIYEGAAAILETTTEQLKDRCRENFTALFESA